MTRGRGSRGSRRGLRPKCEQHLKSETDTHTRTPTHTHTWVANDDDGVQLLEAEVTEVAASSTEVAQPDEASRGGDRGAAGCSSRQSVQGGGEARRGGAEMNFN